MFAIALLVGCAGNDGFIGDEIGLPLDVGDAITLDPRSAGTDVGPPDPVDGDDEGLNGTFFGECLGMASDPPVPAMIAVGGDNHITITHGGIETGAEPMWTVTGEVSEDGVMVMEYGDASVGDPVCMWELTYTIWGVRAGTWTVRAEGDEATAVVTGETW